MNIVYFTDEVLLNDAEVRRHTMRIPEVLHEVRKAQPENPKWDLIATAVLEDEFRRLDLDQKQYLVHLMQRGLWNRLKKQLDQKGLVVDLIIRRDFYQNIQELLEELALFPVEKELNIYIIGPGYDDLPLILQKAKFFQKREKPVNFVDMMAGDQRLHWFWRDVRETMGIQEQNLN